MTRKRTREQLWQDITGWYADGVIDEETLHVLQQRYESQQFGWIGVIKYLGITGGLFAFFGILGLITALAESGMFAAIITGGLGGGITYWGVKLAADTKDRYAISSKVILTLGVILWTSAIAFLVGSQGMKTQEIILVTGLISLPIGFFMAYRTRNQYLLMLALLGLFHWIGSWNQMLGRSTYAFSVQDPRVMSAAALASIAVGVFHERQLYPKLGRFYMVWEALGLVYLNMSLLILSIWSHNETGPGLWIFVFTAATLAQIVLGAAWQNGLFRGFGITFFVINVFTRYQEYFWNQLNLGLFLLIGGGLLVALGAGTEFGVRMLRRKGGEA